jgi:putative radical SAM enzyme (TIGR03279 family)
LLPGDTITEIDGTPINDFLDFYIAAFGPKHTVMVLRGDACHEIALRRGIAEDTGAETGLEGLKPCDNRCIFCFVDQLPPDLRPELYFKDEDYRLSFLHGNYLTLTNLRPADERRIVEMHLSPLYVSVHTTDEGVRGRLLGRRPKVPVLNALARLGRQGIRFHTQIVVVPGFNDGENLRRTLGDLSRLHRMILSISVVPVGLTRHRQRLPELRPVDRDLAVAIVDHVAKLNAAMRKKIGRGVVCASDEMFTLADLEIPPASYYDDFPQIENGVGLVRQLVDEAKTVRVPSSLRGKHVRFVTGYLARPYIEEVGARFTRRGLRVEVVAVENTLLGPTVTVSGLLPGKAMIDALRRMPRCDAIVLPPDVVNADNVTLDDIHVSLIGSGLATPVVVAHSSLKQTLKQLDSLLGRS